jgi:rod shape-determining protein MreD
MRRAAVIFLTLFLLWAVTAQVNDALAGWNVYLFAGGLFVTYAALMLPLHAGFAAIFLGGLVCDATTPVAFGTHALLFATAFAIVFQVRDRVPRKDTVARVVVALLANLAIFLVLSFDQTGRAPVSAALWTRLLADLLSSQLFVLLVAPWFFALQTRALDLAQAARGESA